jgi:hypothetical protein
MHSGNFPFNCSFLHITYILVRGVSYFKQIRQASLFFNNLEISLYYAFRSLILYLFGCIRIIQIAARHAF